MSIVAYKDGVLASDTGMFNNGMKFIAPKPKIFRSEQTGILYGMVGRYASLCKMQEQIADGLIDVPPPNLQEEGSDEYAAVMIYPDGKIKMVFSGGYEDHTGRPYIALGAPMEMAIGVMEYGGSAIDAVHVCIERSEWAHGSVIHLLKNPIH